MRSRICADAKLRRITLILKLHRRNKVENNEEKIHISDTNENF